MSIGANKVITMNYTLRDGKGNVIQSTKNDAPFSYLSGKNQILPKLEEEIDNMLIGGKKKVKLVYDDAYGKYDDNATQQVNKADFPKDMNIEVGMEFMMNSPEGKKVPFNIKSIIEDEVTIDFNHPLAGMDLEFEVELLDVRDASVEELQHGHVHGPGGHHH
jgi:FKBP-type peptidyl-prolyl cis-trans isomerase SlyD